MESNARHAVFAFTAAGNRYRISEWMSWPEMAGFYSEVDDPRHARLVDYVVNGEPVSYFAGRAQDDAKWACAEHGELKISADRRPQEVKLTRAQRTEMLRVGRTAIKGEDQTDPFVQDDVAREMATWIDENTKADHLEYAVLSDYAHAAARFLMPRAGW